MRTSLSQKTPSLEPPSSEQIARSKSAEADAIPLEVRGLQKSYRTWFGRRVEALRGIDWTIHSGQVLGLVGPNGSGKTTAIRCALGLLAPSGGASRIFGQESGHIDARRGVGFAPERFVLSGKRSGMETLALLGRLSGLPPRDALAMGGAALDRMGIADAGMRPIAGYSKGMNRRLSIAAAIQHDPRLLVLDEPFDGLDPLGCALVRDEIARAASTGVAVLVSSHALSELESVSTDLLVLNRGRVLEQGSRDDVLRKDGVTAFEVDGIDAESHARIVLEIEKAGGVVRRSGPARESLEELFRRQIDPSDLKSDSDGPANEEGGSP